MTKSILCIPDVHCVPQHDNSRLEALGNFILAHQPDVIVCLGDFFDMASLSSYDKGKRSFEGRRYKADIEAGRDGLEKLFGAVRWYNDQRARNKKSQYKPETWFFLGNHEQGRIDKVTNLHPELHETISVDDLGLDEYFDNVVQFKDRAIVEGFAISHYFTAGNSPEAIGGLHQAHQLLVKNGMSSIVGHSHMLDTKIATRADGQKMLGISAGCYCHPDHVEGWNADTQYKWWNGVVLLNEAENGYSEDIRTITQAVIMRDYS